MAEDPVSNLLRQHFKKVRECLQDKKNFDILTRFNFRFTSDKAIDNTDINTDDEYMNAEFELSQKTPEKLVTNALKSYSDTSIEEIESEEFQAETDFETDSNKEFTTEASSSVCNAIFDDNEEGDENAKKYQLIPHHNKPSGKSLLERPDTPMLEMYDSEDESYEYDTTPRKMEGSQKFILHPEQLQAGDLNFPPKNKHRSEKRVDRTEILEILPRKEKPISRLKLPTPEENERAFHKELEMYKRDIKLEKTIQSLSLDANLQNPPAVKTQAQSYSCDQCRKTVYHRGKVGIVERPKDELNHSRLETSLGVDIPQENSPKYLKKYFEEANTNVCRKVSQYEQIDKQPDAFHLTELDDEIFEGVNEKNWKIPYLNDGGHSSHHEEIKIPEQNYIAMNHLEIQKQMTRRIEDMYKTGDGK